MHLSGQSVVVGIDGSETAKATARFVATYFADAKEIVLATVIRGGAANEFPTVRAASVDPQQRQRAQELLDDLGAHLREAHPDGPPVTTRVCAGDPAEQLAILGDDAGLLALGFHGSDRPAVGRIGTTSRGLPGHALCSVLIHRPPASQLKKVVVGMDTSEYASVAALDAADFAVSATVPLHVVVGVDPLGNSELVRQQVELDLTWLRSQVPGLDVSATYAQGPAAEVLATAAGSSALLVLGKRGLGLFAGMAVQLGRTAAQVIDVAKTSVLLSTFRDDPRLATRRIVG